VYTQSTAQGLVSVVAGQSLPPSAAGLVTTKLRPCVPVAMSHVSQGPHSPMQSTGHACSVIGVRTLERPLKVATREKYCPPEHFSPDTVQSEACVHTVPDPVQSPLLQGREDRAKRAATKRRKETGEKKT